MVRHLLLLSLMMCVSSCLPKAELSNFSTGKQKMQFSFKYAYVDRNGNILIDVADYQSVGNFSEGLAAVQSKDYRKGFIDKSGNLVIKPQFYEAGAFSEGLAIVKIHEGGSVFQPDDKWGAIDKIGQIVFEMSCDRLYGFSEGVAVGKKGNELFFIDKTGKKMLSLSTDKVQLEYSGNQKFSEGLLVACDVKTKKCGFMDKTGKFVIEPKFHNASFFSEGLARVSIIKDHEEYLGFINHRGEYVIPPKFDIDCDFLRSATDFSEELASLIDGPPTMTKDPDFIFIDKTGNIVLKTEFFRAEPFHEGLAVVWDANREKYGFIDKSGKVVIPVKYQIAGNFSEGLAFVAY